MSGIYQRIIRLGRVVNKPLLCVREDQHISAYLLNKSKFYLSRVLSKILLQGL